MSFTKLLTAGAAVLIAGAELVAAAPGGELGDLAARVDYGFYGDEPRVIEAARTALERYVEDDAAARYYFAFSAFRLAQLDARRGDEAGRWVDSCIDSATPADDRDAERAAAEGWILVAACASVGEQERRRDQALERARVLEPKNPRVALLDAWAVSTTPALAEPAERDAAAKKLEAAVAAFDAWDPPPDAPDWGEAEALAQLGELALQRGEARTARDLIERALLLAPDYRFAEELLGKLQGGRSR